MGTESKPKADLLRTLRFYQGFLLALIVVAVIAAGLKISQEPRSNGPISSSDLELFDHDNGDGTYTTYTQTNAYARFGVIAWLGPTNMLSLTNQEYYYNDTSGDVWISNICNLPVLTNTARPIVLTVDNSQSTNITVRWLTAFQSPDGSRSLVITNGQEGIVSLRLNQLAAVTGHGTNIIGKIFY